MSSPLSSDLRERVVHAVEEGSSRRGAARRFGVSPSSAIRWQESFVQEGRVAAKPQGGDRRSQHVEAHADLILSLYEAQPVRRQMIWDIPRCSGAEALVHLG